MVPFSVIDLSVDGLGLGGSRAHVQHLTGQYTVSLECFFYLDGWRCARILALLLPGFAVAEKHQPIGLCRPEVKRDGSRLLRCPLAQCHVRLWGVKGHGV
uniref:Uncharacterized protein n=1 Tax=Oreochromis niloticus TaxID=8128 RepID=A0A669F0B0_ORENI